MNTVKASHRAVLPRAENRYHAGTNRQKADATITMAKAMFGQIMTGRLSFADAIADGRIGLDGDVEALLTLFGNLDTFEPGFDIVTP